MVQGSPLSRRKSLLPTLAHALGVAQLLGWLGWILVVRAGQASLGLRLIQEQATLRWLSELGVRGARFVPACLAVSGTLVGLVLLVAPARKSTLRALGALLTVVAAGGFLTERGILRELPYEDSAVALGLALAALFVATHWSQRILLAAGSLAVAWQAAAQGPTLSGWVTLLDPWVEAGLLSAAAVPRLGSWRTGGWALIVAGIVAAICLGYPAATRHILVHLSGLGQAGLPWPLAAFLLGGAIGGIIASARDRGWASTLQAAVIITTARNPDYPAHALLIWAATLFAASGMPRKRSRVRSRL